MIQYSEYTDEDLMLKASEGELDAIAQIFERFNVGLYNFFLSRVNDPSKAEDLTQMVFEKIIKYRTKYKYGVPFKSWFYKIAWNTYNDEYRKKKLILPGDQVLNIMGESTHNPEDDELAIKKSRLKKALNQLNEEELSIIQLIRFDGLKYAEAAEVLGFSLSNFKVKVHRTMKTLRNHYFNLESQ